MSTYELEDDLVRKFVVEDWRHPDAAEMANLLAQQLPKTAPTRLGAVVRTQSGRVFLLDSPGEEFCWRDVNGSKSLRYSSEALRVVKILAPGIDL